MADPQPSITSILAALGKFFLLRVIIDNEYWDLTFFQRRSALMRPRRKLSSLHTNHLPNNQIHMDNPADILYLNLQTRAVSTSAALNP